MKADLTFNIFAVAVLCAWVPVVFLLFAFMPARRAVILSIIFGYLFLPEVSFTIHTLPNINKISLSMVGVILASLCFDGARLFSFKVRLIDLCVMVLTLSPMATSLSNGLGIMDGFSTSLNMLFSWGMAYWIGRAYFGDWSAVRELVNGIIVGGLAYVPFCWWETRMSPMLMWKIYGMASADFRLDNSLFGVHLPGFRPNVFLANGLSVTMLMGTCTILAYWTWQTGAPKRILGYSTGWITFVLFFTTVFSCKAVGGIFLMLSGISALALTRYWPKTRVGVLVMMFIAPVYIAVRTAGEWSGDVMVQAANVLSSTRAESLEFRLKNEDLLAAKALERPFLGWGGWSRSHVYDLDDKDITISDGLWIISLGERGFVGLGAFILMVIGSAYLVWRRIPTAFWSDPACSGAVALMVVITVYMVDGIVNATFSPIACISTGAIASTGVIAQRTFSRRGLLAQPAAVPAAAKTPAFVSSVKDLPYGYSPARS